MTKRVEDTQYEYRTNEIIVTASSRKDIVSETVREINGQVYNLTDGQRGDHIGNFNGYMRGEEMRYSVSEMSRQNSAKVWDAIDEIEPEVLGAEEEQEAQE